MTPNLFVLVCPVLKFSPFVISEIDNTLLEYVFVAHGDRVPIPCLTNDLLAILCQKDCCNQGPVHVKEGVVPFVKEVVCE